MALTVETGEGLENADSLVSLADARAFATSYGLTLPAPNADCEVTLRKACIYLLSIEHLFKGQRVNPLQSLPFPRSGMTAFGGEIATDTVPICVKNAITQLAAESLLTELLPTTTGNAVVEEQIGPIKTKFSANATASPVPTFPAVMALLAPVLQSVKTLVIRV